MEQALTWSSYYSDNTAKYHIGSTPDGLITFISKGYGGRISDEKIVKESKYLESLPPGNMNSVFKKPNFLHYFIYRSCRYGGQGI